MADSLTLKCSSCGVRYVLPATWRPQLEGRAAFCFSCERWWVPVPAATGPSVRLVKGRPERAQVDLRPFVQPTPEAPAKATTAVGPDLGETIRVPVSSGAQMLRIVISMAGVDRRRKGVFDLAGKRFYIGQSGCHLNLGKAAIPERAIRIQALDSGFQFEGIEGFQIPIGGMSIGSGQVAPGGNVVFRLDPYEVRLETSRTPGRPIADLDAAQKPEAPTSPTVATPSLPTAPPAASQPAAPASPSLGPQPIGPRPASKPPPPPAYAGQKVSAGDLRAQIDEIAVDVRRDQPAFAEQQDAMQEALDGDATITDLGAMGFQASRFGNPLEGVDFRLIRVEGPEQGQEFRVSKSPLVIGRTGGDLIIRDRRVSSKHAQLDIGGPRIYTLKDLASTNGTMVNDRPISVGHVADGDVVSFGGVKFEVSVKLTR